MRMTRQCRVERKEPHRAVGRRVSHFIAALLCLFTSSAVIADQADVVAALESQCAAAREAQIKPLREAEVAKCKAARPNDPEYCERYWSDYGNAKRLPNGTMSPRMFDNLPICISAAQARQAMKQSGQ
jgi:hypothetical protein